MAINETQYDSDTDVRRREEPATAHDVTEGGVLGAVGGAVVGGLAGGPVGAAVGAVAGGAASAGAVDIVDKHDNDYDRTRQGGSHADVVDRDPVLTSDRTGGYGTTNIDNDRSYRTDIDDTTATTQPYGGTYDSGVITDSGERRAEGLTDPTIDGNDTDLGAARTGTPVRGNNA